MSRYRRGAPTGTHVGRSLGLLVLGHGGLRGHERVGAKGELDAEHGEERDAHVEQDHDAAHHRLLLNEGQRARDRLLGRGVDERRPKVRRADCAGDDAPVGVSIRPF